MRKLVPVLLIIIVLGGFEYYYVNQWEDKAPNDLAYLTEKRYLEIAQSPSETLNFIADVKQSPDKVIEVYTGIRKMFYKEDYDAADRENLVRLQRNLLHESLLEKNPLQTHLLGVEAEVEKWKDIGSNQSGFKIIGSKSLPAKYYPVEALHLEAYDAKEAAIVKTVYYTNDIETKDYPDTDIYSEFVLVKNSSNEWVILGWEKTDEFLIVD